MQRYQTISQILYRLTYTYRCYSIKWLNWIGTIAKRSLTCIAQCPQHNVKRSVFDTCFVFFMYWCTGQIHDYYFTRTLTPQSPFLHLTAIFQYGHVIEQNMHWSHDYYSAKSGCQLKFFKVNLYHVTSPFCTWYYT